MLVLSLRLRSASDDVDDVGVDAMLFLLTDRSVTLLCVLQLLTVSQRKDS